MAEAHRKEMYFMRQLDGDTCGVARYLASDPRLIRRTFNCSVVGGHIWLLIKGWISPFLA